jgi:hypothetical protein
VPALLCFGLSGITFILAFLLPLIGEPDPWIQLEVAGSVCAILGGQFLQFWIVAKTYSLSERFEPHNDFLKQFYRVFSIERGLILGSGLLVVGSGISAWLILQWIKAGFVSQYNRWGFVALTLIAMAFQAIFGSFLVGLLSQKREREAAK